jgi:hypothetical protein
MLLVAFAARVLVGCCDECVPDTLIALPPLTSEVAQTVTVGFANTSGGTPKVTCTWESGPEIAKGDWTCVPPPVAMVGDKREYHFRGEKNWFIQATGPSGSTELENPAVSTDPGEGWPGSCPCYPDELEVDEDELSAIGAAFHPPAPPTYGSACSTDGDCDPALSCESSAVMTGVRHCTYACSDARDCPEGSLCSGGGGANGRCDPVSL